MSKLNEEDLRRIWVLEKWFSKAETPHKKPGWFPMIAFTLGDKNTPAHFRKGTYRGDRGRFRAIQYAPVEETAKEIDS